jgi:hypothetical protein
MGLYRRLKWAAGRAFDWFARLFLLGALLTAFVRDVREFPGSASWPSIPGEVIASQVILDDDGFSRNFAYRYSVEGKTYSSTRVTFFEYALFTNRFQNEQFVDAHPVGSRVRILYNPNNPDSSVLMRTIPLNQVWSPLLLVLCLGSGLFLAVAGLVLGRLWRWAGRRLVQSVSAGGG